MKKKISKSNLNIFKNYLIPNNKNKENNVLPNLITKNGKNNNNNYLSISSLSNNNLKNKNKIYRMQLTSNVKSLTEYNKKNSVIYTIRKSDHKMKYKAKLEKEEKEKLQNLVNYFKELDYNNPKTKYDIKYNNSLNESNYKDI